MHSRRGRKKSVQKAREFGEFLKDTLQPPGGFWNFSCFIVERGNLGKIEKVCE